MLFGLSWIDHAFISAYLAVMILLGAYWARRQRSDEEYFLAGRSMPWFAVGISVIASILSSLTYLSEPGEVWKSGVTHVFGKMLAIPIEMVFVWVFCIPFLMRFRFTSAYEYLEHRFGVFARRLGAMLFVLMVVLWMGFVVLASAKALAQVSQIPLIVVIASVGIVATIYTMLGGLRAVIWTDVIQVALLIGGGLYTIGFVAITTGSSLGDWYAAAVRQLDRSDQAHSLPLFSLDPFVRATVVTVALHMCIWHVCTHISNQMTVQRYFSTSDVRAARRSFVTGSLFGVGINLLLVVVGLAVLYYYFGQGVPIDNGLDPEQSRDLIFPTFAVTRLPPGLGGAILAALLAAAMSSIDSGINSIATVISLEVRRPQPPASSSATCTSKPLDAHVTTAQGITLAAGLFITGAAYGLSYLPEKWGIVGAMPRTFNAITAPLGSLFLLGMFMPWVGQRAAVAGVFCGLVTSVSLGYYEQLAALLNRLGLPAGPGGTLSFTWIMPASMLVTLVAAMIIGAVDKSPTRSLAGLTWYTRQDKPT